MITFEIKNDNKEENSYMTHQLRVMALLNKTDFLFHYEPSILYTCMSPHVRFHCGWFISVYISNFWIVILKMSTIHRYMVFNSTFHYVPDFCYALYLQDTDQILNRVLLSYLVCSCPVPIYQSWDFRNIYGY